MPNDEEVQKKVREDDVFRDRLIAWLAANGIDANHVPPAERPSLVGGELTLRMFTLSAAGRRQFDPTSDEVLTHTVTMPVVVEPDAEVLTWLTPPCPTCGR
jgi:hypothetical protein